MRIVITGGNGQLGRSLRLALANHAVLSFGHQELDIADARAVDTAIAGQHPRVVIHTAAVTDTARCEREPKAAHAINGIGTENVAKACQRAGARLVAVSTNEVFDGSQSMPYAEDAPTGPLNAYGISKLEGESLAATSCADTLIARTSWLYGDAGSNFIEKVRAAASSGRTLSFVTDEVASPTSTEDLAVAIRELIERNALAGIYHLANSGEASRYDWALDILRRSGMSDISVEGVTTEQLRANGYTGPRKPPYSVLANTRAAALGITLRPWREALAAHFERAELFADA